MPSIETTVPLLLIASVVVVSLIAWTSSTLRGALVLHPVSVRQRMHLHRLITAGWLHADVTHLLFNMLTLWVFAHQSERALGTTRFLILYLTAVPIAFVPTTLRYMRNPRYTSLGASGAVAAVIFSTILLHPKMRLTLFFLPILVPGYVYALAYLAYSAWHSWRSRDGINHDAHFSGAIYGALLTFAFEPARAQRALEGLF